MKILVTGAGGFLGIHVVDRLLAHGYTEVRCFLRDASKAERLRRIAKAYPDADLEFCYGNLRSRSDCAVAVKGVSHVFHLAAGLKGAPAELFFDSVAASRNLLESLVCAQGIRVILISSFGVYGVAGMRRGAPVDEGTPLETHPEWRDPYSHAKLRQEQVAWNLQRREGFELVVLRPGVIYGPGGGAFSTRVGLQVGPMFFHLGGRNPLPLSFVENCAEAIVMAGLHPDSAGQVYNVHDDDLPTAASYLRQYKKEVKDIRSIRMPYFATRMLARWLEIYHRRSLGQLPAILTSYKVASSWGGNRFDNSKLHSLGWRQIVSTPDAIRTTFEYLRRETG